MNSRINIFLLYIVCLYVYINIVLVLINIELMIIFPTDNNKNIISKRKNTVFLKAKYLQCDFLSFVFNFGNINELYNYLFFFFHLLLNRKLCTIKNAR